MKINIINLLLVFISICLTIFNLFALDFLIGLNKNTNLSDYKKYDYTPKSMVLNKSSEFNIFTQMNNYGFRGHNFYQVKQDKSMRILTIGDSFVYGWGVNDEDTWVNLLERRLNTKYYPYKIEVINLGVSGSSPKEYLELSKKYIPLLKPDYVILGITEGNDFISVITDTQSNEKLNLNIKNSLLKKIYLKNIDLLIANKFGQILSFYFPNINKIISPYKVNNVRISYLSLLIKNISLINEKENMMLNSRVNQFYKDMFLKGEINPNLVLTAIRFPNYFIKTIDDKDKDWTTNYNLVLNDIIDIKNITMQNKAELILLDIPYGVYVSNNYLDNYKNMGYNSSDKLIDSNIPMKIIEDIGFKNDISYRIINLSLFREQCTYNCYYKYDDHFNPNGHKLLASLIYKYFIENRLIEKKFMN